MLATLFDVWGGEKAFWLELLRFLSLTLRGLGLGLLISIPVGILLSRVPRFASPVISALALLQTIPGLALLGFCISILAIEGGVAAVTAAVVYSVFPIVLNTFTGINEVDARIKDSARGMGMTSAQILVKVELPLAMPVIMAGVRTGAVYAIGMITVCALAGAGGLGAYVTRGISRGNTALTLLGVLPILMITALLFWGLGALGDLARRKGTRGLLISGGLIVAMALYALGQPLLQARTVAQEKLHDPRIEITLWQAWQGAEDFTEQASRFVLLTMRGLGVALLVGIPIGIALTRRPRLAQPIIDFLGLIQTIPSLALLGFCVSLLPLFGATAAVFATVVYALFPLVLNTYVGIMQVDPKIKDSAKGMGMTANQILFKVEIPLALPVIMAGVRTAATYAISMVTISTLVGARGLGQYVVDGMNESNTALILVGVIPILILSFAVFWGLSALTTLSRKRVALGQKICGALIVILATYGLADPIFRKRPDVRIGSKNFIESRILAEMMSIMLEEHTDLKVEMIPGLGSNFAYKSLQAGLLDAYPEYTGTLLTADDALAYKTIPKNREGLDERVRTEMKSEFNLILLKDFGLDNGYAITVRESLVEKRKKEGKRLEYIGDLTSDLKIVMPQEFLDRPDGMVGLRETYNLPEEFAEVQQFTPSLIYEKLLNGSTDVVVGFATDWQIEVYRDQLTVLKDDKRYFPSYLAVPLVQAKTLQDHPEVGEVLNRLNNKITFEEMRHMNREVIANRRGIRQVAREFLEKKGLISKR